MFVGFAMLGFTPNNKTFLLELLDKVGNDNIKGKVQFAWSMLFFNTHREAKELFCKILQRINEDVKKVGVDSYVR